MVTTLERELLFLSARMGTQKELIEMRNDRPPTKEAGMREFGGRDGLSPYPTLLSQKATQHKRTQLCATVRHIGIISLHKRMGLLCFLRLLGNIYEYEI